MITRILTAVRAVLAAGADEIIEQLDKGKRPPHPDQMRRVDPSTLLRNHPDPLRRPQP